ncbi:MAG: type II toxin-antitoxin system RelE/ParE family toxin [Acidobacteriaceae bacterium]|nr:type II toxin-antitoxin system RelE/ParE family toxin [Acidobacteriaceae bacterium]
MRRRRAPGCSANPRYAGNRACEQLSREHRCCADLENIWEYIARDNLDTADRWIGKLFAAFEALGQTPGLGHKTRRSHPLPGAVLAGRRVSRHLPRRSWWLQVTKASPGKHAGCAARSPGLR